MTVANFAAVLEDRAAAEGWATETAFLAGERSFTHHQVHDGAARFASRLEALGAARGDRILLVLPDGPEFAWAFLGALRLGAIAVPVNPRLTASDHAHVVADAGPRVVVCGADLAGRFAGRPVVVAEDLQRSLATSPPHPAVDVDAGDAAYAQYTSGTTGRPKGALHTHGDPLVYFDAFARPAIAVDRGDVVLSVSKLYFAYGLGNALFFPLLAGCRAVLHAPHPTPGDIAALCRRHRVSVLFSVPTFYAHLVAHGQPSGTPRVAVSAGEPLLPELAQRARSFLGCPILDGLGSTEVGQTFASNTLARWRDGTVGRALAPYRVSVRDADGREVTPGDAGELWVAGPTVLTRYVGESAPPPRKQGEWLYTGDRATLDIEGNLHLLGRADDIELVGGMCVAPVEIEALLLRHPAVTEVAVAGVVDIDGASELRAFAVLAPGTLPTYELARELEELARGQLAPFKVPRTVVFVDALPRTPTGKLRRYVLRTGTWTGADQASTSSP